MNMTKTEWKKLFKNKILLISVIAIICIPILYSSIFDTSVWDPYGHAKDLPVAVVNEDQPVDFMGQKIAVGDQVVANLKDNHDLDWNFVSREEADQGMKDLKYYMIITLNEDFSKNASSVLDSNPTKMEITYETNESLNYIAQEISQIAATTLESQIKEQVITSYIEAVVKEGTQAIGKIEEASDGAKKLANGSSELNGGINQYTNGVIKASDGSSLLSGGIAQLLENVGPLTSGVNKLDAGSNLLSSSLAKMDRLIAPFQSEVSLIDSRLVNLAADAQELAGILATFEGSLDPSEKQNLDQEISDLQQKIAELMSNQQLLTDIANDSTTVSQEATAVSEAVSNVPATVNRIDSNINADLDAILSATSMTESEKNAAITQIQGKVDELVDQQVSEAQANITTELEDVSNDAASLSNKIALLANDAQSIGVIATAVESSGSEISLAISSIESDLNVLATAVGQVNSGSATNIVSKLTELSTDLDKAAKDIPLAMSGVKQLTSGSSQLSQGLDQLQSQMPTLAAGVLQLNSGAGQLSSGLSELNQNSSALIEGSNQLQSGTSELSTALEAGSNIAKEIKVTDKNVDQFASPTNLRLIEYSKVSNYGEALAPYILSLALFVGCMLFNFIYPIRKVSMKGQSSGSWWLSKVSLGFVVASMMALVQATIMLIIGLPVGNVGLFYLTAFISAWAYMAITMFLAMTFDNPGRFVAMILLVLQLGGAGGTFPIQLQGTFFQTIHPFLPMSYSVYAFREAISSGIGVSLFTQSMFILVTLVIVFGFLLRFSMHILQKKHLDDVSQLDDNQELQALEN